jgi:hypothetical protein
MLNAVPTLRQMIPVQDMLSLGPAICGALESIAFSAATPAADGVYGHLLGGERGSCLRTRHVTSVLKATFAALEISITASSPCRALR